MTRQMRNILVTGGAGYIGSHSVLTLREAGFRPIIIDDLSNSSPVAVDRIRELAGDPDLPFIHADVRDQQVLDRIFQSFDIHAVIHFAGLKAVGESVAEPLSYFSTNLGSTLVLLEVMRRHRCHRLVFSSSATVYGSPEVLPIPEDHPLRATNPYGRTKLFIEDILRDLAASDKLWRIALLRYFNPVGAHPSGKIGESPLGPPNNLFPCITQAMTSERPELAVFGTDYPTPDGSGVRDYIHVTDLARGHVAALGNIDGLQGAVPINLGTGNGYSVLEVICMFEEISGRLIPWTPHPRRPGDVAECYAHAGEAERVFGWTARSSLRDMCQDSWNWQSKNPAGYASPVPVSL